MNASWQRLLSATSARWSEDGALLDFGHPEQELEGAVFEPVVCPLSDMAVIEVSGADALTFLQNQLSNDLRDLADGASRLAAYCTPKGRMLALFRVIRRGDAYLLCFPRELAEAIGKRLQMFVLRSKVVLRDVSEQWLVFGTADVGPEAAGLPALENDVADAGVADDELIAVRVRDERLRFLWLGRPATVETLLLERWRSVLLAGPQVWRWLDIRAGLPQVFATTQEEFIPQMANLDLIGGISFNKGCYPGQEIVARMHYLGNLKRRMYHLTLAAPDVPAPGAEIRDPEGKLAGTLVMAAPTPGGGCEGLAVLQIEMVGETPLLLDGQPLQVRLPPYRLTPPAGAAARQP